MKTQEDLYLEYAQVITMVREYNENHGTDVKPWECVRTGHGYIFHKHPEWTGGENNYQFAIAILEVKPVFFGDILYGKSSGGMMNAKQGHIWDLFTWTPPQKKRTFEINGVELPCPEKTGEHSFDMSIRSSKTNPAIETFCFNSEFDLVKFYNGIRAFLIQARDKE